MFRSFVMVRRFLVVLVAAVLGLSVLVGVGSPVGAANTASEVLFDHDGDPDTSSVRRFGGSNRYATSVALAEAFVGSVGSGGFVDSVIVASGVSVVDAAAAAGLAASKSAPVLLTTPNRLSAAVEDFIVDEFITDVFIVGGVEAVSQAVEDALSELVTVRSVKRLGGVDRYASSVVLAEELGSPGVFCQSGLVTAVLVNADVSFADVIAVGPLAYALELPVLLTRVDELPVGVAAYLVDAEVERVVVVGGEAAVSQAVVDDLTAVGVSSVTRLSGDSRFATAVEVLNALDDCATVSLNASVVALINADAAADGVSAAPFLGSGADGVTAVLLVQTDQLPAETSDYLASIPLRNTASELVDQSITAIGGTAVVSAGVMQAAINAAATANPLTAEITAPISKPGETGVITIKFSGNVELSDDSTSAAYKNSALNKAFYTVGGGPLIAGDVLALVPDSDRSVKITLIDPLEAGDVISIIGGKISGVIASGDKRLVATTTLTIEVPKPDNLRPNVQITAADNAHEFSITVTEKNDRGGERIELSEITWKDSPLPATAEIYYQGEHPSDLAIVCLNGVQDQEYVATNAGFGLNRTINVNADNQFVDTCKTAPDSGETEILTAGDIIAVGADSVKDVQGNTNRSTRARVTSNEKHPTLVKASLSTPKVIENASATWTLSDPDFVAESGRLLTSRDKPLETAEGDPYHILLSPDSTHETYWSSNTLEACTDDGNAVREGRRQITYRVRSANEGTPEYNNLKDSLSGWSVTQHTNGVIITYFLHDCGLRHYTNNPNITSPNYELIISTRKSVEGVPGVPGMDAVPAVPGKTVEGVFIEGTPAVDEILAIPAIPAVVGHTVADVIEALGAHDQHPFGFYNSGNQLPFNNNYTFHAQYDSILGNAPPNGTSDPSDYVAPSNTDGGASANYQVLDVADLEETLTIKITANKEGIAKGAAGNAWQVNWTNLGPDADTDTEPSVSIDVITERSAINIVFEDNATLADILTAAESDTDFTNNFTMELDTGNPISNNPAALNQITGATSTNSSSSTKNLEGGVSDIDLTLQYNDVLESFDTPTFINDQSSSNGAFTGVSSFAISPVRYYRYHTPIGENIGTDYVHTGEEELLSFLTEDDPKTLAGTRRENLRDAGAHKHQPRLCPYNANITAAMQKTTAGPAECRLDTRGINMSSKIVLTIRSHNLLPERGQTLRLANSIARSYRHDVTATEVTVNADSSTTRYGASLPNTKILRSG